MVISLPMWIDAEFFIKTLKIMAIVLVVVLFISIWRLSQLNKSKQQQKNEKMGKYAGGKEKSSVRGGKRLPAWFKRVIESLRIFDFESGKINWREIYSWIAISIMAWLAWGIHKLQVRYPKEMFAMDLWGASSPYYMKALVIGLALWSVYHYWGYLKVLTRVGELEEKILKRGKKK